MNSIKSISKILSLSFLFILLLSCNKKKTVDYTADRINILQLHKAQRDHHFNKDSIAFANQHSDNFISVNRGIISHPKKESTISKYNQYFSSVEFVKWDDETAPIIKFSDDGSLAYTIVDKIVVITYEAEEGKIVEDKTHYAWTTIYKKYDNTWKIDCVTSTEKPVE